MPKIITKRDDNYNNNTTLLKMSQCIGKATWI